ncbi:flagellar hook-associated protein FlgK [Marinovum sp. KMM 9879]
MSLNSALSVASSGLQTTSRWAETVSGNIANAGNAGYARREAAITTDAQGTPTVSVITRAVDASLDAMYRTEVSRTATQDAMATGLSTYTNTLGDSESSDTILTRLTDFQGALGLLAVSPSDAVLQQSAVSGAQDLALSLNRSSDALQVASRLTTRSIVAHVGEVNASLSRLQALNERMSGGVLGDAQLAIEDQVNAELDGLAELIDFTLRTDTKGRVELFTTGGTALLTGNTAETLRFDAAAGTLHAGDIEITPGKPGVRGISEGALAGQFTLMVDTLPKMQAQLDEVARALIEDMAAADGSLPAGAPGLFTDAGAALTDPFEPGLATRIAVNDAIVAEAGGASWRIRDGIGAMAPGAAGDNSQAMDFAAALSATTGFDAGAGLGDSATLPNYISSLIASQNTTRANAETNAASLAAGAVTIQGSRSAFTGVNLDDELQQLTAIQQSYAANARTLTTVSEMFDTLLAAF